MKIIRNYLAKRKAARAEQIRVQNQERQRRAQEQREEQQHRALEQLREDWAVYFQRLEAGWNGLKVPQSYVTLSYLNEVDLFETEEAAANFFSDRLGREIKPWEVEFGDFVGRLSHNLVCRCGEYVVVFDGDSIVDGTAVFGQLADDRAFKPCYGWLLRTSSGRSFEASFDLQFDILRGLKIRKSELCSGRLWKKEDYGYGMPYGFFKKHMTRRMAEMAA